MAYPLPKWTTIDFETEKILPRPNYPPKPVGVAIKHPGERKGRYYAWAHPTENNCSEKEGHGIVRDLFNSNEPLLFQEAKFDCEVAAEHVSGVRMPHWSRIHDTKYMLFLRNPHAISLQLKSSAEEYLGMPPEEQDELKEWVLKNIKGAKASDWGAYISLAPGGLVGKYAVGDVVRTDGLGRHLLPYIHAHGMMAAYDRERRLMPILLRNEQEGIRTDLPALEVGIPRMEQDIETCDAYLRKRLRNKTLNVDSDAEFAEALAKAKIVRDEDWLLTKTGRRSTSKKNLLPGMFKDQQVFQAYSHRNKLMTCKNTFAVPWLEQAHLTGGTIHTSHRQVKGGGGSDDGGGARSGRKQCVKGDTLVVTLQGLKRMDAMQVGDLVFTHRGRWRKVLATYIKGEEQMHTVHFSDGNKLTCTKYHRLLTLEHGNEQSVGERSEEHSCGAKAISRGERVYDAGYSRENGNVLRQRDYSDSPEYVENRDTKYQGSALCTVQDRQEERNARQDRIQASSLEGRVIRWRGCGDLLEGWREAICPSYRYGESIGFEEAAPADARTPYRLEPSEQRLEQLGTDHQFRTQNSSPDNHTGIHCVTITSIEVGEICTVFDIAVEDDESYAACGVFSHNTTPNFQNIPKNFNKKDPNYSKPAHLDVLDLPLMRRYLLPDLKCVWGRRDYNQQELRILAHFEDGSLLASYLADPRYDMHQLVQDGVHEIVGIFMDRDRIKAFNFQDIYGGGIPAFCTSLDCDEATARRVKAAKRELMPDVAALEAAIKEMGRSKDYEGTFDQPIRTWGGREYYVEPAKYVEKFKRWTSFEYKLLNYLIQGSAADCTKEALVRYDEHPKRQARLLIDVHDEINISMPAKRVKQEMAVLREVMQSVEFDIPMLSDGETGLSWGSLTKFEEPEFDMVKWKKERGL